MARSADPAWERVLKVRRQIHARFAKAEREGRLDEEGRLFDEEVRKEWGGIFEFEPALPPVPGTLRLVPRAHKPKRRAGKRNKE